MALEGTLRDFSLADILQLISLQGKTGLLALKSPDDTVTLGFSEGKLVSAESSAKRMDTRLGTVLVKTQRLSGESLQKALEIQGQTLQRLGFILLRNGFCSAEDLRDGLDIQIRKITYGLFRWTDGDYVFDQQDRIDYDHEFVSPISVESLLMEGARMMDEWPIIEKVVRSMDQVYQRVAVAQPVVAAESEDAEDDVGESTFERRAKEKHDKHDEPIRISPAEWAVYELVDGGRSVGDIVERTFLSEFEGCKAFYDLVSRGLIEEVRAGDESHLSESLSIEIPIHRPGGSIVLGLVAFCAIVFVAGVSLVFLPKNPMNVLTWPSRVRTVEGFEKSLSLLRVRRLAEAVDTFFLTSGRFPDSIDALVSTNLVGARDLLDPWGRRYRYVLQPDKFYLVGFDREGKIDPDIWIVHSVRSGGVQAEQTRSKAGTEIIVIK